MDLSPAFEGLNDRERIYCESRLRGMSKTASSAAAGLAPGNPGYMENQPHIAQALERAREISVRSTGVTIEKVTEMLMDAYRSAATAAEMVMAARELGKLHDLYPSAKVKIDHSHELKGITSEKDMRRLSTKELMRLANLRGADTIEAEFTEVLALPSPGTATSDRED